MDVDMKNEGEFRRVACSRLWKIWVIRTENNLICSLFTCWREKSAYLALHFVSQNSFSLRRGLCFSLWPGDQPQGRVNSLLLPASVNGSLSEEEAGEGWDASAGTHSLLLWVGSLTPLNCSLLFRKWGGNTAKWLDKGCFLL